LAWDRVVYAMGCYLRAMGFPRIGLLGHSRHFGVTRLLTPVLTHKDATGEGVSLDDVSCDSPCRTVTINPYSNLAKNTKYKATITTKAKDLSGNAMTKNYAWTFTTGRR
jgi:Bacterial Ig-like domain